MARVTYTFDSNTDVFSKQNTKEKILDDAKKAGFSLKTTNTTPDYVTELACDVLQTRNTRIARQWDTQLFRATRR